MDATLAAVDLGDLSHRLRLRKPQIESVVALLDDGNTVPFITRYRKDQTGGLDEEQIRQVQDEVRRARQLAERKQTILRSIESQGKLTAELAAALQSAQTAKQLEDLYLPYRPQKQTLATAARERGLLPLAQEILDGAVRAETLDARAAEFVNPDRQLKSVADVLLGVGHILAEQMSERADLRCSLRKIVRQTGKLSSCRAEPEEAKSKEAKPAETADAAAATAAPPVGPMAKRRKKPKHDSRHFRDYFEFSQAVDNIPPHRILAINRGERGKILRVRVEADGEALLREAQRLLVPPEHPLADFLRGCAHDALGRLVLPSLERELRRELTERAEQHAVRVFARNLRALLLQPPVSDRRTLAVDPGFKNGCKLAALDPFGKLLAFAVVHLVGKEQRRAEARAKLLEMIKEHQIQVVAIGNGTGCREAEDLVSQLLAEELKAEAESGSLAYVVVNEAGASVYSTSQTGREEFPQHDAALRGAISIGRRLQDPLSELVKIDAANIGVGLYQHDVKAKHLRSSLDEVVESCVNYVGVDLNTASVALLRYVSGLNQLTARRLYEYRTTRGPFVSREQLREVPGFGEATYVQAAGFLKIPGGANPLDASWIHPESYPAAQRVLERISELAVSAAALSSTAVVPVSASAEVAVPEQQVAGEAGDTQSLAGPRAATVGGAPSSAVRPGAELAARVAALDVPRLACELGVGELLLADILSQLTRPGRDPREALPPPIFKRGVLKMEDLSEGMELNGTVLNVVDFGAFIDIGLHDSGLVHVSQVANRYVRDPNEVISVGDVVRVWVTAIDKARRRVSLTMIPPGTAKPAPRGGGARRAAPPTAGPVPGGPAAAAAHATSPPATSPPASRPPRPARPRRGAPYRAVAPGGANAAGQPAAGTTAHTPQAQRTQRRKPPERAKPLVPISKDMLQGKEPMRTFGDLLQFMEKKKSDGTDGSPDGGSAAPPQSGGKSSG